MNQSEIKFIFFDLGNVIVHFDHSIGCSNVANLTGISEDLAKQYIFDSGLQLEYESGSIDAAGFAQRFNSLSGLNVGHKQLGDAISSVFSLNRQIVPLITQLVAARFPIGILSNTCLAHWTFILSRFQIINLLFEPRHYVLSYESTSMKPDEKIYRDAIAAAGIAAANIFFMDDRQENVAAARDCGIQAEQFTNATSMVRFLAGRNIAVNL